MFWDSIDLRFSLNSTGIGSAPFGLQLGDDGATVEIIPYFKLIKINELKNVLYLAFGVSSKMHSSVFDSSTLILKDIETWCVTMILLDNDIFSLFRSRLVFFSVFPLSYLHILLVFFFFTNFFILVAMSLIFFIIKVMVWLSTQRN